MELKRQLGLATAILIIIADVIGTGIFITTGQALSITKSSFSVLVLFALGGLMALAGSLCYAELATMWPDDGGEYVYLKKIYGVLPSFLTGWVSIFIAFSLAAAMSSITAVNYINKIFPGGVFDGAWAGKITAAGIVLIFSIIHAVGVQKGSLIQNILTVIKLAVVFLFIGLGFYFVKPEDGARLYMSYTSGETVSWLQYGSALVVIMYAYSGWNGATYIAGEIKNPEKNLPRALFFGTLLVTLIYLAMNVIFIVSSPGDKIISDGLYTIGALTSNNLFGAEMSPFFNVGIILILLSSVSVQMMIGPRVTYAMAQDKVIFKSFQRINPRFNTPDLAILVQMSLAIFYVFIGFNAILKMLIYMGLALSIFPLLTVMGVLYLRIKRPDIHRPFKAPFFPLVPLTYIIMALYIITATVIEKPKPSIFAIGMLLIGIAIFYLWKLFIKNTNIE